MADTASVSTIEDPEMGTAMGRDEQRAMVMEAVRWREQRFAAAVNHAKFQTAVDDLIEDPPAEAVVTLRSMARREIEAACTLVVLARSDSEPGRGLCVVP